MVVKFFIHPPLGNLFSELRLNLEAIKEADNLGIDGFVLPDHYMSLRGNDTLEAWVTLAHFAAMTSHIMLGTLVTPIPLRPPQLLAKMVSTVDVLSEGRSFLGVGAGWNKEEFEAYSQWDEPKVRVEKVDEAVALIKKLWTEPTVDFEGKHYRTKGAVLLPKPVQKPHPPLLFGGQGPKMLKLAGKYADICLINEEKPKEFLAAKNEVKKASNEHKRPNAPSFACIVGLKTLDQKDEYRLKIKQASELEVSHIVTGVEQEQDYLKFLRFLAEDIMPSFR
jgi:alkanesulfonate monooxygenase SsuD/methylene tetrahydromethanopterin reductase-like flavin-dependent oxidoreductase (luciferase family)